jgi:tRNA1(Val) A37 N6-methylase TrmN6
VTVTDDPEGVSTQAVFQFVDLGKKRILEIGSGNGRMTFRLAEYADQIIAIEPDEDDLQEAINATPAHLKDKIEFVSQGIEDYQPPHASALFDLSIFSWSL